MTAALRTTARLLRPQRLSNEPLASAHWGHHVEGSKSAIGRWVAQNLRINPEIGSGIPLTDKVSRETSAP